MANYGGRRTKTLVEGYSTLKYLKTTTPGRGLDILCELADFDKAIRSLSSIEYISLLLVGLLGLTEAEAAKVLSVHQSTVSRRYTRALEILKARLNGDEG